jgi:hypothetical protein
MRYSNTATAALPLALLIACSNTGTSSFTMGAAPPPPPPALVVVEPPSARLPPLGNQAFAATPPTVQWSVKEGSPAAGSITTGGLYTAPGTVGHYTVVAFEPTFGVSVEVPITVTNGGTSHGMTIPVTHPRIWYNGTSDPRYVAAAARGASISLATSPSETGEWNNYALKGMLTANSATCRTAINHALSVAATYSGSSSSSSMDHARWDGETLIFTWDWCYPYWTAAERSTFVTQMNRWLTYENTDFCSQTAMVQGNYFWGSVRNHLLWGIASYDENATAAETFITAALGRYNNFLQNAPLNEGGLAIEGSQYGPYLFGYALTPFDAATTFGNPLWDQGHFWKEAVYGTIYLTIPGPRASDGNWYFFPHSDVQGGFSGSRVALSALSYTVYGNFMTYAAEKWNGINIGKHAAAWVKQTGATRENYVAFTDPGNLSSIALSSLPLDYYAAGEKWLFTKDSWAQNGTALFLQMGDRAMQFSCGHGHVDWGSWQMWRNGRWLSRETTDYNGTIPSFGGGAGEDTEYSSAHNVLWVQGQPSSYGNLSYMDTQGLAVTRRLESRAGYSYGVIDLTAVKDNPAHGTSNTHMTTWVREYVFFRGLGTLMIVDRIQSDHATDTKSIAIHSETSPTVIPGRPGATIVNGTEALDAWVWAVPSTAVTFRTVNERTLDAANGQYRIEADTNPGATMSYIVQVLQGHAAAGAALSPSISDDGTTITVTLDGSNAITFVKGAASSGGSITAAGTTTALTSAVQGFSVTDSGPAWQ